MMNNSLRSSENVCTVALRPNDFDTYLILNNSVYLELFEMGRWRWGLMNGMDFKKLDLAVMVIRIEIDYIKPIFWNPVATVNVRTKLVKQELYSFYLQQQIELAEDLTTKGLVRISLYDRAKNRPVLIDVAKLQQCVAK